MSRPESYPPGVPCFVETVAADPEPLRAFYGGVFGWEFSRSGPLAGGGEYWLARVDGRDVAGIAPPPPDPVPAPAPAWDTHVLVDSAAEASARAARAGGSILHEPFDVMPAGRMAVVADPSGAVVVLWEAGSRRGAQSFNEPSAYAMSALSTDDPERAQAFYGALFGWEADPFEPAPGMTMWLWRLPGYLGGEPSQPVSRDVVGAMAPLAEGEQPRWDVDFWIADAERAAAAAESLGGRVLQAPFEIPMFRRTVLADPRGAVFSVSQLLLP